MNRFVCHKDIQRGKGTILERRARVSRALSAGWIFGAATLVGLVAAAPAQADTQSYLQKLAAADIKTPGGDAEMKEWGWEICALFAMGVPPDKVVQQAVYNSGSVPQYGMTVEQANLVVDIAVSDLCTDRK